MLYAIVGKKRSGKDTVAEIISSYNNANIYQLAEPIKIALHKGCNTVLGSGALSMRDFNGQGVDREAPLPIFEENIVAIFMEAWNKVAEMYPRYNTKYNSDIVFNMIREIQKEDKPWSIRRMMQTFGTDICVTHIDKLIWTRPAIDVYLSGILTYNRMIITDIRQDHEIKVARSVGAKIIHVQRPDTGIDDDAHITERGIAPLAGEEIIVNDSSLEILTLKVVNTIRLIG